MAKKRDLTIYNKQYYEANGDSRKRQIMERQHMLRDVIQAHKIAKGCARCGYNKSARALQFHHRDKTTKEHNIARMVTQGRSLGKIMQEVEKCDVICANCHAELHELEDMAV
jgi:hypothetical protein